MQLSFKFNKLNLRTPSRSLRLNSPSSSTSRFYYTNQPTNSTILSVYTMLHQSLAIRSTPCPSPPLAPPKNTATPPDTASSLPPRSATRTWKCTTSRRVPAPPPTAALADAAVDEEEEEEEEGGSDAHDSTSSVSPGNTCAEKRALMEARREGSLSP